MADANESEQPATPEAPGHAQSAERQHEDGHEHEQEHDDQDSGPPLSPEEQTGFSFEQRRFLWTLTGLNIVAVLLGAAIIVAYQAYARSQDKAVIKLEDASEQASRNLDVAKQRDINLMIEAKMHGDDSLYLRSKQELIEAFRDEREKFAAWRNARGLEAPALSEQVLNEFEANIDSAVAQYFARLQAATRPATRPAKTTGSSTTKPATTASPTTVP